MKHIIRVSSICLFILAFALTSQSQKRTPATAHARDTATQTTHKNQLDKAGEDVDEYIHSAEATKARLKNLFPSKGDTVYLIISGITYADPNLKLLKQQMDGVKNARGLTSGYKNGTAVIKIIYKDGDASKLYDKLSDQVKGLFIPEEIEGNRAILNYTLATSTSGKKAQ
jgi:hypothetical protein